MGLEKISEYKKSLNLTNDELAKLSGVPKGTLDKILSGVTKDPKLGTLKALAKVLKCTLDDFDDNETPNRNCSLSDSENILLEHYNKLDNEDKNKVVDYAKLLHNQDKYNTALETDITSIDDEFTIAKEKAIAARKKKEQYYKDNSHLIPKASHDKEGNFSAEDIKHDDDLMLDDDLWNE